MGHDLTRAGPGPAGPPRTVEMIWGLLILNTLGSAGARTIVPLPRSLIQMATMGALATAFALALVLNLGCASGPVPSCSCSPCCWC